MIHNHKFIEPKSIKAYVQWFKENEEHNEEINEDIKKKQISKIKNFLDSIISRVDNSTININGFDDYQ